MYECVCVLVIAGFFCSCVSFDLYLRKTSENNRKKKYETWRKKKLYEMWLANNRKMCFFIRGVSLWCRWPVSNQIHDYNHFYREVVITFHFHPFRSHVHEKKITIKIRFFTLWFLVLCNAICHKWMIEYSSSFKWFSSLNTLSDTRFIQFHTTVCVRTRETIGNQIHV